MLFKALKLSFVLFLFSLLIFVVVSDFMLLLKLVALDFLISSIFLFLYPYIRGIKKGDKVSLDYTSTFLDVLFSHGVALSDARTGQEIEVKLPSGGSVIGVVESYEGILSPPKVKVLMSSKKVI